MTAPEDCALRASERVLVKTPPGGEKPGHEAVWFPADGLARAGSAATAINRRAERTVISRHVFSVVGTSRCDVRAACSGATSSNAIVAGVFVPPAATRAGMAQRAIPTIPLNTCISRPIRADERAFIIFADCKIIFSRKHNQTAGRDLQVTIGRVCSSGRAGEFFPRLEDDARAEVKPDAGVGNPGLRGQRPPFLDPPPP